MSDSCTPSHQARTQSSTRATKGIPLALPSPGRHKASPTTPPRQAPGPHHTHHANPPTAEKHHGNHSHSKHRKAQRTANPNPRVKINPEVQSSHDTCRDSVHHDHRKHNTPTIGKTTRQARNNPHTTMKQSGQSKGTPTTWQQETEDKIPQATPEPSQAPTRVIIGHRGQTSSLDSFFLTHD